MPVSDNAKSNSGVVATKPVARTGLEMPGICFGTSSLGHMPDTYGYDVDEARARDTLNAIFDGPAQTLDTARNYGFGRSEERIGAAIRARGGLPDGFILSTKIDRDMETNRFDADRVRQSLAESLTALSVDHVQILHLHDPEYADDLGDVTKSGGAVDELFRLKEEGIADAVGLAAGRIDIMMPILRDWPFDALITHNRYTLANRNAAPMIELARERGIAVLNAAPYCGGVLAKGVAEFPRYVYQMASDDMLDPIREIEAICARHDIPPGAAALQFSMRDPDIVSTICGVSRPERVHQTVEWANWPIPEAAWAELLALPFSSADPEATRDYKPG
ncbi:MAG: aldo/keto reductase [Alphaproteobacteria bacterium]